jgi:hypothetical protein
MALNICDGEIVMTELYGPKVENGTKLKEYAHFACEKCGMDCYRQHDLNKAWVHWEPDSKIESETEFVQTFKNHKITHADICRHEKHSAKPADYQTLIHNEIKRRKGEAVVTAAEKVKVAQAQAQAILKAVAEQATKAGGTVVTGTPLPSAPNGVAATVSKVQEVPDFFVTNIPREFTEFACKDCKMHCTRTREKSSIAAIFDGNWQTIDTIVKSTQ